MNLLPNYQNAFFPEEKLTRYALDKSHVHGYDKAIAFERALGYNLDNYQDLIADVLSKLRHSPATLKNSNEFGQKFEVRMTLLGPNGKSAKILTGWIIESNDDNNTPRLTTIYVH